MGEPNWERGEIALKFQIGDRAVGRASLSLFRRSAFPDEKALDTGEIPDPPPRLGDADGYVVWSHPIAQKLPILRRRGASIVYTPKQYRRFSISLAGDFEQYMASFSGKTRSSLRRKLRKFADASGGPVDWRCYRTAAEIDEFFPLARHVSAKTYQERLLNAGLPVDPAFLDTARGLAGEDRIRAFLLFLKGQPISYLYCPVERNTVLYNYLGYDPAHAELSPGTVLQILALTGLFAEQRFEAFDFTEGEGQHKEMFSTQSLLCGDIFVLRNRIKPVMTVVLHRGVDKTASMIGALAARLGLKARLRRWSRGN